MSKTQKIQPGDTVRHLFVKGFSGLVTAATTYLNGCRRIAVQPTKLKDGAVQEARWFDENELRIIKWAAVKRGSQENGGPRIDPVYMEDKK